MVLYYLDQISVHPQIKISVVAEVMGDMIRHKKLSYWSIWFWLTYIMSRILTK